MNYLSDKRAKNVIYILSFIIFIVATTNLSFAQKLSITDEKFNEHKVAGDKYFEAEDYYLASIEYHKCEKLKPTDHYTLWRLAESYRLYQDYDDAEIWYEKLGSHPDHNFPLAVFWKGLMEKVQGKYEEAEVTISEFTKTFQPKSDEDRLKLKEAEFEYKGCIYALEQKKKPLKDHSLKLLPAPVNSKANDYAPMIFFHDSSIVITSARADAKGTEINMATGEARSDNFRFEKNADKWVRHHNDDNFDVANTSADDGAGELTHDQTKYYYTQCNPECAIFVSKKVNGKFTKAVKLNKNINASGYWNAQPTVSPTADTMFFVSKRPGGKGEHDLWMSVNKDKTGEKEDWGPAINLANINTPYIELSPFWDDHTNTIYFASNGHEGFGGWDIYVAKGVKRDSIVNLGMPFNSSRDDFYFTLGKVKGYLVSNRPGGFGHNDIYSFDIHAKESEVGAVPKDSFAGAESVTSVGRIILGDNGQPLSNVSVYLKNDSGSVIKEAITNANGEFRFENLPPDKNFKIIINENDPRIKTQIDYQVQKKPGADVTTTPSAVATKKLSPNKSPVFESSKLVVAKGKVVSKSTKKPVPNAAIVVTNEQGDVVKTTKTNAAGQYSAVGLTGSTGYETKLENPNPDHVLTSSYTAVAPPPAPKFEPSAEVQGKGTVVDKTTNTPVPEVPIVVTNDKGEEIKKTNTNASGEYFVAGLTGSTQYNSKLETPNPNYELKSSFSSENKPVTEPTPASTPVSEPTPVAGANPTPIEKQETQKMEPVAYKENNNATPASKAPLQGNKSKVRVDNFKISASNKKPSKAFFENVYFDFNSVEVSPAAKKAMDLLVTYYGSHKDIQIEIKAYTDGFGKPEYNKELAQQRAQACFDYFVGRGVDQTALLITPIGEGNFVGNNNSFAGRQLNRRVEFTLIGASEAYEPEAMAHILEPRMTLWSMAKRFGMTMDELKEMNGGLEPGAIKAYSVIRVKRPANGGKVSKETFDYINSGTQEMKFENNQFVPVEQ
ncbi:MAG: carboxypeptidase regulatory-like domain-containing protein [Bacteroidota bacterium]|nr:carboxypeptidase regulatory-like domain-containing protein [Bacteroidota bacterium]